MTTGANRIGVEGVRPLPVLVRPRAGEGNRSFIARRAQANHLRPSLLLAFLHEPSDCRGTPVWSRLAAATRRCPDALRATLETRHCLECGAAMPPTDTLGRKALRCSQQCRHDARRRRIPTSTWRRDPCLVCGQPVKMQTGQRRPLCSSACRRTAYLERQERRTHAEKAGQLRDRRAG
ncbi:DUF2116 family Zn-ribbon domain-containing protein [Streptomyces sp. 8L]|uniref:DUF2116 family Zn-ribbon domain-containing protein n=1 Tax=Streptomyces sp. 8L TaxID=2877242 RepID=UPI001CD54E20|nr:DUF2116 family Zn-ribbon domain-containing protein [Streptomyces sp. 8L]MCA1221895.1 DUF2116 family Zn-ribbon domain-containing protein [Streptomyces sp. 8L]